MIMAAFALGCSSVPFNQTVRAGGSLGPYYPPSPSGLPGYPASAWLEVSDADLTQRKGVLAKGLLLDVHLRVHDSNGAAVAGATVELWSVNSRARYICEPGASVEDPGFVGFGRTVTAADGRAFFRTVWPVSYSRYVLLRRPPHLHLRVKDAGRDDAWEVEIPPPSADVKTGIHLTLIP